MDLRDSSNLCEQSTGEATKEVTNSDTITATCKYIVTLRSLFALRRLYTAVMRVSDVVDNSKS